MTPDEPHARSVRTKRKPPTTTTTTTDVSHSKRRRHNAPDASSTSHETPSTQTNIQANPSNHTFSKLINLTTRTNSNFTGFNSQENKKQKKKEAVELFSRYTDPSVQSPASRGAFIRSNSKRSSARTLYKRPCGQDTEVRVVPLTSKGGADGVVDLTAIDYVGKLEMVEGDEILHTLIGASSPRVKRQFPSEKALTDSEQRDRDVLRRRRLELRSQFSAMKKKQPWEEEKNYVQEDDFGVLQQHFGTEKRHLELKERVQGESGKVEDEIVRGGEKEKECVQLMEEEEDETDEETTESKINRLSKVVHMNWRQFIVWLVSSAILLCAMVVAAPFVQKLIEPSLRYCDSEWTEADEGSYVLTDPVTNFDRSKALQPFISTASVAPRDSKPVCQPCPVYGNCLNGSVISCAPPYELQSGVCKENPEVQTNLDQLASRIQKFIVEKASKNACANVSLWRYLESDNGEEPTSNVTTLLEVWLSDVQTFVTDKFSLGKAASNLPRDYVFHRALDMALRDLKDVFVTEDQTRLVVGGNVVPWSCRAKHQLYAHMKLIAFAVALGTVLVFAYRQFLLYRTERELVDRFVKEVRFYLLDRTRRIDRFYPANHLRDDLFEQQSLQDRKWLCKSVWPKVAAVLKDDSRVSMRVMRVRGEDMVVWEWASSTNFRRAEVNRGRGSHAASKPQKGTTGDARSVPSRRRKKHGRMSLPW